MRGHVLCVLTLALAAVLSGMLTGCNKVPVADFTATPTTGDAPLVVAFSDASRVEKAEGITGWAWNFGDGGTSIGQNPVHTYNDPGSYAVSLTVTHENGKTSTKTVQGLITVATPGGEGEGEGEGEPGTTLVTGFATQVGGSALALVDVELDPAGLSGKTDPTGMYQFEGVDPQPGMVVRFSKAGFTTNSVVVDGIPDGITTANAVLKKLEAPLPLDSDAGGEVVDGMGNLFSVPAGAFVTKSGGKSVGGEVDVSITPLDVTDPADLAAFPGNFRALAAGKQGGEEAQLETFALADFTVTQDGGELDLAPGAEATIELVLPETTPLVPGEEVPLWSFDEASGLWIEEGVGVVVSSSKSAGLAYRADITHLSWWNCDQPIETKNCVRGRVVDGSGAPVANAPVEAAGVDYNGVSAGVTGADGAFCMDVKRNSTVVVRVYLAGGNIVVREETVNVPDAMATCALGGCVDLGDLPLSFDSCVKGRVMGEDGLPVAGVEVRSSAGSTAVTDSDGYFCMETIGGAQLSVWVAGRPAVITVTPVSASCAAGDCAEVLIELDYPEDGDLVGMVTARLQNMYFSPVKDTAPGVGGSASFFVGLGDGAGFGPVTEDSCGVAVRSGDFNDYLDYIEGVLANIGALDPGTPGLMTVGSGATDMLRDSDNFFQEPGMDVDLTPLLFGMFSSFEGLPAAGGDLVQFSWPGGLDIGPFDADITLPAPVVVTAPELTDMGYGYYQVVIDPNVDLNLAWDASNPGDYVTVTVNIGAWDEETTIYSTGTVTCTLVDDGSHVIPAALLQQLPVSPWQGPSMTVTRYKSREDTVPLTRGGEGRIIVQSTSQLTAVGSYGLPVK